MELDIGHLNQILETSYFGWRKKKKKLNWVVIKPVAFAVAGYKGDTLEPLIRLTFHIPWVVSPLYITEIVRSTRNGHTSDANIHTRTQSNSQFSSFMPSIIHCKFACSKWFEGLGSAYVKIGNGFPWMLHGRCASFELSTLNSTTDFWLDWGAMLVVSSAINKMEWVVVFGT